MPTVCIERPNRREPRKFTIQDIQRISKNVQGQGVSPFKIVGYTLFAVGLGAILCKASRLIDSFTGVFKLLREISIVLASSLAIKVMIEFLKRSPIIRIPILNKVVIIVIVILVIVDRIMERFANLLETLEFVEPITDTINNICEAIIDAAKEAIEKGEDLTDDLLEFF